MSQIIHQVDAFTTRPFGGNPAAVCVLPAPALEAWMQAVASEMNLSETAFLHPTDDGYRLRWFTPAAEVDLCGHATLASAHVLWETGALTPDSEARFQTRSGLLSARRRGDLIELNFPCTPAAPVDAPDGMLAALGLTENDGVFVGKNRFDYIVEIADAGTVRELAPDFAALGAVGARGVMVTSAADDERYDFISRYFAPAFGIDEDPVTGSTHCCLGPHWAERLGKTTLRAYQASARGGEMQVTIDGERVRLAGTAVTVLRGELFA
jgi:PhzF family phenazine biosynthesis protein